MHFNSRDLCSNGTHINVAVLKKRTTTMHEKLLKDLLDVNWSMYRSQDDLSIGLARSGLLSERMCKHSSCRWNAIHSWSEYVNACGCK